MSTEVALSPFKAGVVLVPASANREGVPMKPEILELLHIISGEYGSPITVYKGTDHSQYTSSGNVSDHWNGYGADIAVADLDTGDKICAAAFRAAGVPTDVALSKAKEGGIYNIVDGAGSVDAYKRRIQIIWRAVGHYNHVHVGVKRGVFSQVGINKVG